jgi:cytochrome c oxidase subunit 4
MVNQHTNEHNDRASALQNIHEHEIHSVAPLSMLFAVFGALLLLTALTLVAASIDFGSYNVPIALCIATVKASLVAWFFMHLSHDTGFNRLAFFGSFIFVGLFVLFTLLDTSHYQSHIDWHETVQK